MSAAPVPYSSSPPVSPQSVGTSAVPAAEGSPMPQLKELVSRLNREHYKVQDILSSLGFALRSFNNLNQFLELIPLMASRVSDADGSALILFKPNGQLRVERVYYQDQMELPGIRRALEAATRQAVNPLIATTLGGAITFNSRMATALDHQVGHYLGSDMQLFGSTIVVRNVERGRLYVFSNNPAFTWTEARQKLVRLVADQTAVAIANDELTNALRQKERIDRELEIGAEIQANLLPRQCPKVYGIDLSASCKTAGRVGGDYYDFIPAHQGQLRSRKDALNESGCWGLAIGDVMGKGVPAGLIMTMLRGMLRAEVLNGHTPARILQHLNRVMYTDLENSNRFVTLFYSEYNPKTRVLSYSNAAHHPPLLWQASSQSIRRLDTLGMLIGLDAETQYQDAQVQLQPGDTLIYYTDGFTDAANRAGARFDEENLVNHFSYACQQFETSNEILAYLFDQVQQFIGPNNTNGDDMTLIVMRVKETEEVALPPAVS